MGRMGARPRPRVDLRIGSGEWKLVEKGKGISRIIGDSLIPKITLRYAKLE